VFKRRGATAEDEAEVAVSPSGKGRPTPSRKTAEAARAARVKPPKNTREARQLDRRRTAEQRAIARKAMAAGDPRYLPVRDQGPAKAWIRNLVDARWSPGELVLPAAGVAILISLVSPIAYLLLYVLILGVIFDSIVLARKISYGMKQNFPDEPLKGKRMYGILRASQYRRMRMPKPVVPRQTSLFRRSKRKG
jgi:hypothetical protein